MKTLTPPLSEQEVRRLRAGEVVRFTGRLYTARDRAYARAIGLLRAGKPLPIDLRGGVVYHCGPLAKEMKIVSAGPTTSARLDHLQAEFVGRTGARVLIGKGGVGDEVAEELARLGCVYLAFPGGAGVLAARAVARVERVLWRDLGEGEALWVLGVRDFGPLVVAIDTAGGNLYER